MVENKKCLYVVEENALNNLLGYLGKRPYQETVNFINYFQKIQSLDSYMRHSEEANKKAVNLNKKN